MTSGNGKDAGGDAAGPVAERAATGRTQRRLVPRRSLGGWDQDRRREDALDVLLSQNAVRVPEVLSIRYGRMATSPWHYYRGAAAVMAADLATAPRTDLTVQLCGDAHVLNFGLWATPERNLAFDLRDFDETLPGPFEWDVKRLVTSLVVVARENGQGAGVADDAVAAALGSYRSHLTELADASELDVWYDVTHVDRFLGVFRDPGRRERVASHITRRAPRRTSRGALAKLTERVDGRPRITEDRPFRVHLDPSEAWLAERVFARYTASLPEDRRHLLDRFRLTDVARQVVGVGSVGMRVYLVLLEGRRGDDPLFLQCKQATTSVYEPYLGASRQPNHGERVVAGKRLIQSATDIFVGWTAVGGTSFYVRQFRDMKVIPDSQRLAPYLVEFAEACGAVLARAHARTGDAAAIDAYVGNGRSFDAAMASFATAYADQNERDHAQLVTAVARGDVEAAPGW